MSKLIGGLGLITSQSPELQKYKLKTDEKYRTTFINFEKYKLVMFAMAKLMEMEITQQNKVTVYLLNSIYKKYN